MRVADRKGFTLVELLVVIAIIGILTTITVANLGSARARSRDAKRKTDARAIQAAIEAFYADYNVYPPGGCGGVSGSLDCTPAVTSPGGLVSTYLPAMPLDPRNVTPFVYTNYARACTGGGCSVDQGYSFEVILENQNDPDGYTSGGQRRYKLCGGANGTASNCSR